MAYHAHHVTICLGTPAPIPAPLFCPETPRQPFRRALPPSAPAQRSRPSPSPRCGEPRPHRPSGVPTNRPSAPTLCPHVSAFFRIIRTNRQATTRIRTARNLLHNNHLRIHPASPTRLRRISQMRTDKPATPSAHTVNANSRRRTGWIYGARARCGNSPDAFPRCGAASIGIAGGASAGLCHCLHICVGERYGSR